MVRVSTVALALCLAGPACAQVHDGIDDSAAQQRIADEFRDAGSKCGAPACHGDAEGVSPPSTRPGEGAETPSISAARTQPSR